MVVGRGGTPPSSVGHPVRNRENGCLKDVLVEQRNRYRPLVAHVVIQRVANDGRLKLPPSSYFICWAARGG